MRVLVSANPGAVLDGFAEVKPPFSLLTPVNGGIEKPYKRK